MRSPRTLLVVGIGVVVVAAFSLLAGSKTAPWLTLGALAIGATCLILGLVLSRGAPAADPARSSDPAHGERLVRVAFAVIIGLNVIALVVALVVPEGEARGHAIFHLLTGVFCVGLFAALAFRWRPRSGSSAAMVRGIVLSLLAAAAIGVLVESLGGSGYDAANEGHRIEALTTLHAIAVPFGGLLIGAVPLGLITCAVLVVMWAVRRGRAAGA